MLGKVRSIIANAGDHRDFQRRISLFLPRSDPRFIAIERAYNVAKDEFRPIIREDGSRYFEHIRAVALLLIEYLRVKDCNLIIAALLHDIVEDIPSWRINRVKEEFGDEVALIVDYATKPSKEEFPDKDQRLRVYHARFEFAPRGFFLLKLADRPHNLLTLGVCPQEKRLRKVRETEEIYLVYAERHFILLHEIEAALDEIRVMTE